MNARQLLVLGASVLASSLAGSAVADRMQEPYVRVAEIDPAQIEAYKAAINEEIEISVRAEPGVLALYAVSVKDSPAHIRIFEMYADENAYKTHLETPHFMKYKSVTQDMVRHLNPLETVPIKLGAKTR
jgi:quinol monooxygenase YgiN